MTDGELKKIIDGVEAKVSKDKATFGIFQYGGRADESFIRADKNGLLLFALELLKAVQQSTEVINDKEKTIIPIECEDEWVNGQSDTIVQYIEPVTGLDHVPVQSIHNDNLAGKLLPIGCIAVIVLLVVSLIVGLWTLAKWVI